jgi:hypothetical protein
VTRIDRGVVSLVGELPPTSAKRPRNGASGLPASKRAKRLDASPTAVRLALLLTDEELDSLEKSAGDGEIAMGGRSGGSDVASPQTGRAPW